MGAREDLRECRARNAKLTTEKQDLTTQLATAQADAASKDTTIAELETKLLAATKENDALEARIAELEAQEPAPEPEPEPEGIEVPPGTNLQTALNAAPEGATLLLSGTYAANRVRPKNGQTLKGPAEIRGTGTQSITMDGIDLNGVDEVTLFELDIHGYGRWGINTGLGMAVIGGKIHDCGRTGIGGDLEGRVLDDKRLADVVVDGCEIYNNGINPDLVDSGGGGIKWFHSHGVTAQNCHIHDNFGSGVWGDAQCGDINVFDCTIERNTVKGVFYEKGGASDGFSYQGKVPQPWAVYEGKMTVRGNTIRDNNPRKSVGYAGVHSATSKNVLVEDNDFGGNSWAVIANENPERIEDDKHGWHVENIIVRNNRLNGDGLKGCGTAGVTCENNA